MTADTLTQLSEKLPAEEVDKLRPLVDGTVRRYPEMKRAVVAALGVTAAEIHAEKVYKAATTADSWKSGTISTIFGGILVIGGLTATAIGAWLGEKLRKRGVRGAYFLVCAGGAIFALPCFLGILYTPLPVSWVFAFFAIFGLFFYTGPGNTILANVVRSRIRATAFAINLLIIHALGDAISPPLIGAIADRSSLQFAFLLTSTMIALGGLLWLWGARYLDEDTQKAESIK